jgi:alanyl-tRNA synthetase
MGSAYPELTRGKAHAERVLRHEEERFAETLANGMVLLEGAIRNLRGAKIIDGDTVFKLYDTYGFPIDLTADIARERGLRIDQERFDAAMEEQRRRSQEASKFGVDLSADAKVDSRTLFQGYERLKSGGRVLTLLKDGGPVEALQPGDNGEVILDRTPFYAEAGGQVGDVGELTAVGTHFIVADTQKRGAAHSHLGQLKRGAIRIGDELEGHVNAARRQATALNHSATHLLHAALRKVLGNHVQQKGSLVAPDRLRFDFAHSQPLTAAELREIERLVNAQIRANAPSETRVMDYDGAVAAGAIALFGEKYDRDVRVLRMGDFSMELCGGTHVQRAGDIRLFKIVGESGVASGVRRIEALTGEGAEYVEQNDALPKDLELVRGTREDLKDKVGEQLGRAPRAGARIRSLRTAGHRRGRGPAAGAIDVQGVKVVASGGRRRCRALRTTRPAEERLKSAVVVLASVENPDKVVLVVGSPRTDRAIKAACGRGGRRSGARRRPGGFYLGRGSKPGRSMRPDPSRNRAHRLSA